MATPDTAKQTIVAGFGEHTSLSLEEDTGSSSLVTLRPSVGGDREVDVDLADADLTRDQPKPAVREAAAPSAEQRSGLAADAWGTDGDQAGGEPQGPSGNSIGHADAANSNGAIARNNAHAATKALLMRMISAGAPYARKLAMAASAGRGVLPYKPMPPAVQVLQHLPKDDFWQGFECVRLSLCSAETRHKYEENDEVKLATVHFSAAQEISASSRTALLLFDVDVNELLGVWQAVKNDKGVIHWRIVRRLPAIREADFRASAAGAVFPELPPIDTSAQARGHEARQVLYVLAKHAASVEAAKANSAAFKGSENAQTQHPPPAAQHPSAPAAAEAATVQAQREPAQAAVTCIVPNAAEAVPQAPLVARQAPPPLTPADSTPAENSSTSSQPSGHHPSTNTPAASAPLTASTDHPAPVTSAVATAAAPTVMAPAATPTITFGALTDPDIPITASAPDTARVMSSGSAGAAAATPPSWVPVQVTGPLASAASKGPIPTAATAAVTPASARIPGAPAASATSVVAGHFVSPRVVPPGTSFAPPPPPAGSAQPPPAPVYLPPVLMLQRQRRAVEAAAPAPTARGPAAVAVVGIHGTNGSAVAQQIAATPIATPLAPGATAAIQVQFTVQPTPLAPPPGPPPVPLAPPVNTSPPLPVPIVPQAQPVSGLQPPAPQLRPAAGPGPVLSATIPTGAAPVPVSRPAVPVVQPHQLGPGPMRPSFLAAARTSAAPPPAPAAGTAATSQRPVTAHAAVRPVQQQPASAPPQPAPRPQRGMPLQHFPGQPAAAAPSAAQALASRPAGSQPAVPAPFGSTAGQPPAWPALQSVPRPPPLDPAAPPAPPPGLPAEPPPPEPPAPRSASALSCPLCIERLGCWFLLACQHMGPCEECCATPDQVQAQYPICMRCNKPVTANKVLKARVS